MTSTTLKINFQYLIPASFLGLMLLAIGKDLAHSFFKDYLFYLSEFALFESWWLLFIPFVLLNEQLARGHRPIYALIYPFLFSLLHIIAFSLLVFTVSGLFFHHTFGFERIFIDSLDDSSIPCLLIYGAVNLLLFKTGERELEEQMPKPIRVKHRNDVFLLDCQEIIYATTERPYIALVTKEKTYLHAGPLKGLLNNHLPDHFIRIHKSTVVNTDCIYSFTSRQNGDYDVLMTNGETLRVSRNYNSYFTGHRDRVKSTRLSIIGFEMVSFLYKLDEKR